MNSLQVVFTLALTVVLLALPSLSYGKTLYVRPTSSNTSCLTQPCHTLSEYVQDSWQYSNESNLTLQFLPGNHALSVSLTITSIHQMKILGNSSAMIPTRVECSSTVGLFFRDISNLKIEGLAFVSCARSSATDIRFLYGLHLQSVQTAEIIDCTFQDSYGSALGVVDSHVVLRGNNSFLNNCRMCSNRRCSSLSLGHCKGGGVFAERSNLSFTGSSSFLSNSAYKGGAVYAESNSKVVITGNTNLSGNSATIGGGVYAEFKTNVVIRGNTTLSSNSATSGGVVFILRHGVLNISENTIFIGNIATGNGGAVNAWLYSNVIISGNTTFLGNSARRGGGVHAQFTCDVDISGDTTFSGNSAIDNGGGIYVASLNLNGNTSFIGNSALYNGGGIGARNKFNVTISGSSMFIGNSAGNGGAIYARSRSKSTNTNVNISGNATFSGNSAMDGGCIFADSTSLNFEGIVSFTICSATNDGGAIYTSETRVNFRGSNLFSTNSAAQSGGGLYAPKSFLNINGHNMFIANSAELRGGGIYAQEAEINISGTGLLSDNVAQLDGGGLYADDSNLNFSGNITIRNNTAQLGGGIYSDRNTFNIDGRNTIKKNIATYYGGGIFMRRTLFVHTGRSMFIANSAEEGGVIYATAKSTLSLDGVNTFMANIAHISGGGIWLDNSDLTLNGFNHFVKCTASYEGGAIYLYAATASLSGNNSFESNSATTGGGIHARWSNVSIVNRSNFKHNNAVFGGGIYTVNSTFEFTGFSGFRGNQANYVGGGIYAGSSILKFLGVSSMIANYAARDGGGIYTRDNSVVNLYGVSNYWGNSAGDTGGVISAFWSSFSLAGQNTFESNKAAEGGGFYALKCAVNVSGVNNFISNFATNHGGGVAVNHGTLQLNGSITCKNNSAASGGGMYIGTSKADIDGNNCFLNNTAQSGGGAIYVRDSAVKLKGKDAFVANSAGSKGAAIHTSFSTLFFQGSSSFVNNSAKYGGGIHLESSNLTFVNHRSNHRTSKSQSCIDCSICNAISTTPGSSFVNNMALQGGAQYLDFNSNFNLYHTAHVVFQHNIATEFGGAIYVMDVPGPGQFPFHQQVRFRSECFFHLLGNEQPLKLNTTLLVFENNIAGIRGSVLYGGLLDKCDFTSDSYASTLELFNKSILEENEMGHSISSNPSQLCFCNTSKQNCRETTQSKSIYPGQQVEISVIAIDQSGSAIPTLTHVKRSSGSDKNSSEIISYNTGENCISKNYSVTLRNLFNILELYPSNRSGNTLHLFVNVTFESCPIGFEQSNFTGECICDHRIWQYTNSCSIDREAILRNASRTFWIGIMYNNGTPDGFIHHHFCSLDFCTSGSKYINLSNPDEQCKYNRSGLLCGKCKEGLSLLLGSSQCKECSNNYLALLVPFALAGVLLVILLFLLHLTVAAGTLHGLIFYANIVAANHHIFFPQSSNNPASIFIAWLNLDLGIQTCFYNGMDAYAKTWLDLVFPVYIWMIVGFLVYISHHSVTATKLLGSSPVPVLATLFFLSYAKILRTIISALSLTILHYPHKNVMVWVHDANVSLAKYLPLVFVALLFLIFLFLPYTLLLLLGQWLQPKSHLCLLYWVKNPKLKAILDTYHAPYKLKHRYWTGLLLFLRCVLFLVFAFNISGDDSVNLLVISSATFGIFAWFALSGAAYKNWYLNALELSFILNLGILAVATYHVNHSGGSQVAVSYTSVGIAFLTFVGIIIYHIYIRIKSKVQQYIWCGRQLQHKNRKCHKPHECNDNPDKLERQCEIPHNVTHTVVDLHKLRSPLDLLDTK